LPNGTTSRYLREVDTQEFVRWSPVISYTRIYVHMHMKPKILLASTCPVDCDDTFASAYLHSDPFVFFVSIMVQSSPTTSKRKERLFLHSYLTFPLVRQSSQDTNTPIPKKNHHPWLSTLDLPKLDLPSLTVIWRASQMKRNVL